MSVKCLDELLTSMFLDDELAPGERKKVESHLDTCARCRELVRQQDAENTQIKEVFNTTPSPDLVPAVMEKLGMGQRLHSSRLIKRLNYPWLWATAASILLAGFLFIFLFLLTPANPRPGEKQVILCSAQVDGQEVQCHIYESAAPDIRFIWLEKEK